MNPDTLKNVKRLFNRIRSAEMCKESGVLSDSEAEEIIQDAKSQILSLIQGPDTESRIEALEALTVDLKAKIDSLEQTLAEAEKTPENGTEGRMRSEAEIRGRLAGSNALDRGYYVLKWVLGED